jgi:predicted ATPase/class 3 adenylate cyclase
MGHNDQNKETNMRRLVPEFIIEKYRSDAMSGALDAAAIFVDVSGFSKLTDTLAKHGQHGAEVLADLMRVIFEPLVNAVYAQGGFVVGYAGDAFNAVFPSEQAPGQEVMRCLAALVAVQEHVRLNPNIQTVYGDFPLSVKAGMGYGETKWQIFKSKDGAHATYWFRGDSLNGAVLAEKNSRARGIALDPVSFGLLKDIVDAEPAGECHLISKINIDLPAPASFSNPEPDPAITEVFFPRVVSAQSGIGEFRQVINVFIDIPVTISDEALVTPFMETVYILQEKYGGFFLRPDLGDKGFNLLLFWGAPIARERDIEYALNYVMELAARTRIPLRAGITYRIAYTGFMGAPLREDYTAYGWGVNLAARLMEHASQSEIWLDEETARRAGDFFNVAYLDQYSFKGFSEKQRIWRLVDRKQIEEKIYQGNLVGRDEELHALASFVVPLRRGKYAGVMVVRGEAGVGKSRFVHTFQHSSYFDDLPTQWVVLQTEEMLQQSFQPFKGWIKKFFGVVDGQSDAENWKTFARVVDEIAQNTPDSLLSAELTRTRSVLAALVNINQPDTLYETLDAKGRYENTFIALSVLFRALSLQTPLIIFLEDIHWLDEDSNAFLSYFVRTLLADSDRDYPIALVATQRPEDDVKVTDAAPMHGINLGRLTSENLAALAQEILGAPISKSLHEILSERADGNPFFIEQILRYLMESELLKKDEHGHFTTDKKASRSLPMDVRAVMIARLDRLSQQVRETVQTASALGREFEVDVLAAMLHYRAELPQHVGQAQRANIWAPLSEIEYIFRHALLRDAAYSMQLFTRQRELHQLAAIAIEDVYRDDLEPHYGELAFHAEKGDLKEKALHYLTLAGDLSMKNYLNRQAADYFTHALTFVPADNLRAQFELLIKRVECLYNLGDTTAQNEELERLETLARELSDDGLLARALTRKAYYVSASGDYQTTVKLAFQAKELAQNVRDNDLLLSLLIVLPDALSHTGRLTEALQYAQEGAEYARKLKSPHKESYALTSLGLVMLELEGPTSARQYQEKSLQLAQQVKDRNLEAKVLNNLANSVGLSQGDYHAARDYFQQSLAIFQELGNQSGKGLVLANLGWISGILGDYPSAMLYYEQALKISRELGQRLEEMYTYINLSASAYGQGNAAEALRWAQQAQEQAVTAGDHIAEGWAYFNMGYAYLLDGKFDQAVSVFLRSIEIREETNASMLISESRAGLCEAYLGLQDQASAGKEAEQVFLQMEKDPAFEGAEEPLRMYHSLYLYLERTKDLRAATVLQNAIELLNGQVLKLRSDEARHMFVENVPWRRALQQRTTKN